MKSAFTKPSIIRDEWTVYEPACDCSACEEERAYRESQATPQIELTDVNQSWGAAMAADTAKPAAVPAKPKRVEILETGAKLTSGERDASYGDPSINLKCAMELKQVYDKYAVTADGPKHGPAHHEAIHMALSKFGRIATGAFKEDNYVDGATYTAIAGEMAGLRQK